MNILKKILILSLLILFFKARGQDLEILNTQDLISVSNNYGLDSAIRLTRGIPIYYIDSITSQVLIKQIEYNKFDENIEAFLIGFSLHSNFSELSNILNNFFEFKQKHVIDCLPDNFGDLPRISDDALIALIEHSNKKTEAILINYYNTWKEKSILYESDYIKAKKVSDKIIISKLIAPFHDCNLNCYKILQALNLLKSDFVDTIKLKKHYEILDDYYKNMLLDKTSKYADSDYNNQKESKTLILNKSYNSIGEIDFNNEPELIKLQKGYNKSFCWKFIMYNKNLGYFDLGCQSAPLAGSGIFYKIELVNKNRLKFFLIHIWIS